MIDAQKDYEQNVIEEEAEEKAKAEKDAIDMEERLKEEKHNKMIADHNKLLAEAMKEESLVQISNPLNEERGEVDRNSAADIIGSGPEINNELVMLRNPLNDERNGLEANSAASMIGSGPELNSDSFVQITPITHTQTGAMSKQ